MSQKLHSKLNQSNGIYQTVTAVTNYSQWKQLKIKINNSTIFN